MFLVSQAKGQKPSVSPPLSYTFFAYRRNMGIGYQQFLETPLNIYNQDMHFMDTEEQVKTKYGKK